MQRLHDLGLKELRLPVGVGADDKHIPILVSEDIETKKHVIVYFGERHNDLGILAYRVVGEEGVNAGSLVNFAKSVLHGPELQVIPAADQPGLVIANPSQLIWYRGGGRAVTDREWLYLPRESAIHGAMRIDEERNRVEGNRDFREHVHYIFEHILSAVDNAHSICKPEAKVTIIGQEFPGSEALQYVVDNWSTWQHRINCIALINPQHSLDQILQGSVDSDSILASARDQVTNFIAHRTRAYRLDSKPLESVIAGRDELGCNVYSAGESYYEESCFVRCWPSIVDWITLCRVNSDYREKLLEPEPISNGNDAEEKHSFRSPRKAQDDELAQKLRFHGDLEVESEGM